MMKSLVICFMAALLSASVFATTWNACPGSPEHLRINTLQLTPDPPKAGQSVSVAVSGLLDEPLTGGQVEMGIYYQIGSSWVHIPVPNFNICTVPGFTCPVQPGPKSFSQSVEVPSVTPTGQYKGNLTIVDTSSNVVACIEWETTIQ